MEVRLRSNGLIFSESDLRHYFRENNGPSWDETTTEVLEILGADEVYEGEQFQLSRYQVAHRDGVEQINGRWYKKFIISDMNESERIAVDNEKKVLVRRERNNYLRESDWTQLADAPVDSAAWALYRQALRDITLQPGFPWEVQWPGVPV